MKVLRAPYSTVIYLTRLAVYLAKLYSINWQK